MLPNTRRRPRRVDPRSIKRHLRQYQRGLGLFRARWQEMAPAQARALTDQLHATRRLLRNMDPQLPLEPVPVYNHYVVNRRLRARGSRAGLRGFR